MRYCITFAGAGDRLEVDYQFDDLSCRTSVIQEALVQFFSPDKIYVLATPKSQKSFPDIVSKAPCCEMVPIPDGKNTGELWEIFRIIGSLVNPGDTILFDLTHGFRSLPFISFLAVAYLQEIKKVEVEKVVYGALSDDRTRGEMIDLTDFTRILQWMMAVHSFLKFSEGSDLSALLRSTHRQFYLSGQEGPAPRRLQSFGEMIDNFSTAMKLARPVDVSGISSDIISALPDVTQEIGRFAPPLESIIGSIADLETFTTGPQEILTPEILDQQWKTVRYLLDKSLILQAVSLSREWIVNYSILLTGNAPEIWLDKSTRNTIEHALNYEVERRKKSPNPMIKPTIVTPVLEQTPGIDNLAKIWNKTISKRNNLAHCGMNKEIHQMRAMKADADKVIADIEGFYQHYPLES